MLERVFLGLLLMVTVFIASDWTVWTLRSAHKEGVGSISVTRVVVAPLKGGRESYYPGLSEDVPCSRSVLPWSGSGACWWLARHPVIFDR